MSLTKVTVKGDVSYYNTSIFNDPVLVSNEVVEVQGSEEGKQRSAAGDVLFAWLKSLAERDAKAPSFGSASSLKNFEKRSGALEVEQVEGTALYRVYHQQASELNEEVSAGKYIDQHGNRTDAPWHEIEAMPGFKITLPVIESNAITLAIYA